MISHLDPYYKKTISYKFKGQILSFHVSQALFSSQSVDIGTQRLLRTLISVDISPYKKILDLGCGYGPIGTAIKKINSAAEVHMIDRDALALEFSRSNASLSDVRSDHIYASLGYDSIMANDFDLIISNIPAKVGEKALQHMLLDAVRYLKSEGIVVVVVIDAIIESVLNILDSVGYITILAKKVWPGHTVIHYKFTTQQKNENKNLSFVEGSYDRKKSIFYFDNRKFTLLTTYNLPEYDTISFETKLMVKHIKTVLNYHVERIVLCTPNHGQIALALLNCIQPKELILFDRNLQSLIATERNLIENGFSTGMLRLCHSVSLQQSNIQGYDCFIAVIPEKEIRTVYRKLIEDTIIQMNEHGILLIAAKSHIISDIEKFFHNHKETTIVKRIRSQGKSLIIVRK